MAMGVPVVASWQAAGGVDAVPGEHILVARSAEDYAEKLLRLMDDGAARRALANAGRARVETNHSWARSMARLDRLIDDCLQRRGSTEQRLASLGRALQARLRPARGRGRAYAGGGRAPQPSRNSVRPRGRARSLTR